MATTRDSGGVGERRGKDESLPTPRRPPQLKACPPASHATRRPDSLPWMKGLLWTPT